jgi:hypothetical protein
MSSPSESKIAAVTVVVGFAGGRGVAVTEETPRTWHCGRLVATIALLVMFRGEVIQWGDWVGEGDTTPQYCTVATVAKRNTKDHKYLVANELIAGRLGMLLGLPTVPGIAIKTDQGSLAYLSLRIGDTHERPPPVIPEELCDDEPSLATGAVVFDLWIANVDRNDENIAYQKKLVSPALFDHEKALLSSAGPQRLNASAQFLGGCLVLSLKTCEHMEDWIGRVESVTEWQIRGVVAEAVSLRALSEKTAEQLVQFLEKRKGLLRVILRSALDAKVFRSIQDRTLFP